MAARRRKTAVHIHHSPTDIAEMLAEQFVNGNREYVKKHLTTMLDERYVPIVTLRTYQMLYEAGDEYQANSFARFLESFTY